MTIPQNIKDLKERGEQLFSKRAPLLSLWQEMALNFYPQRADFTVTRNLGEEFADHLSTSYPIIAHRELTDTFTTMLRPRDRTWFEVSTMEDIDDVEARRWLEHKTMIQRRMMYEKRSGFINSTKQGDADFSLIGQCIISTEMNRNHNALLYRNWHPRDIAWSDNDEGELDVIYRKWKPSCVELERYFGKDMLSTKVQQNLGDPKKRHSPINCMHIVLPVHLYEPSNGKQKRENMPYVSIYIDVDNDHIMEEVPSWTRIYSIPRWQRVSGSQYAYSPATVAALPDARLIQAMTLVLLEVGEKAANPPMIATEEVIRSDVQLYSGGITWVDDEYDEKLGSALRPITQDTSGIGYGLQMKAETRESIADAFYLNKINLPPAGAEMTAFEVGQRIQEYVRGAMPLFEPMEIEYNGDLCEMSFETLFRNGFFGSADDIPEALSGQGIDFKFKSPLTEFEERKSSQKFLEAKAILGEAADLDPSAVRMIDAKKALRDSLKGIASDDWVLSENDMEEIAAQDMAAQEAQQMMNDVSEASQVSQEVSQAQIMDKEAQT